MTNSDSLIHRSNFLLIGEYLNYLLAVKNRNKKSVDRYRFWPRHLLLWAMDRPFEMASNINPSFSQYVGDLILAAESKKKIVETARAFLNGQSYITAANSCSCRPFGSKI